MTVNRCKNLEDVRDILNKLIIKYIKELSLNEEELLQMFKEQFKYEIVFEEGKNLGFYKNLLQEKLAAKCKEIARFNFNDTNLSDLDKHNIIKLENEGKLLSSSDLISLRKHLVYQKKLKKVDCDNSIRVVQKLHHFIGNAYYYETHNDILSGLFEVAINLYLCNKEYSPIVSDNEIESIIISIKYLEKHNIRYDINQENISLSDDSKTLIHHLLEAEISRIGGFRFLQMLFKKEIYLTYNAKIDRYLIHRNKGTFFSGEKIKSRIPYNYLIQISLKHLNNGIACLTDYGSEKIYFEIIEISKCYFNVLDLQSYSSYEDLFMDYKDLPLQISKNMLFEKMFILEQYKPSFIQVVLRYLYKPFFEKTKTRKYSFNEYLCVVKYILRESSSYCQIYTFEEIKKKTNIKYEKLREILEDISCPNETINSSFFSPLSKTNFRDKPLIKLENNTFFLLDSRFCGFAFCEVMYQILKNNIKNLDVEQGYLIEKMIYDFLDEKTIPYKHGKYEEGSSQEGECDLVLENDKYIIFIEIKKRPLPKTFEECDDIALFRTLAGGMVTAQKQLLRHKNYLQNNGVMNLSFQSFDGLNKKSIIQLNDKRIVCISICLPEYTFLTNKIISQKILESLLTVTYHARDEKREKELNPLNKISEEIRELVLASKDDNRYIFHNTLFRSMQQFLVTLENSKDIEDFIDNLLESIYIIDGSCDYYVQLTSKIRREKFS